MKVNPNINEIIDQKVLFEEEESRRKEPSGRLSASRLGWPLQWQMLHYYKVPQKPVDTYTLRKFQRGKDVEERVMSWLTPKPEDMQVAVEYRGVVGFADVVMEYPIEVKSVTNKAFPYKQKEGPSRGHRLQSELYAKALGFDTCGICYVASDDYRTLTFEVQVGTEVDAVIDRYAEQVLTGVVPVFNAEEQWQAMKDYNPYPEWQNLSQEEINHKLAEFINSK